MEGLKEALQYITGLKAESMEPKLLEINGETYCTKDLTRYHRIKDSERGPQFKLVEADGGLWKNVTMKKIKEYLEHELSEELKEYHITVIA